MQAMICEMCGSANLVKQEGLFICQNCGTKYSVEEARKLLGVVKIDKTEETEKLLVLARRAREMDNSENAEKYYDMVLRENPNNWEAAYFQVYYQAMQCNIDGIPTAAAAVTNNIEVVFGLIDTIDEYNERYDALDMVIQYSWTIASMLSTAAINHYNNYSNVNGALGQCSGRVVAAYQILKALENSMKDYFPTETERITIIQKAENNFIATNKKFFDSDYHWRESKRLTSEIKAHEPSYTKPRSGGCYIATAVYGSYDCPEVWTLRRYRDSKLAKTWYGRAFVRVYYAISPHLVRWFGNSAWFRKTCKPKLDRFVRRLNRQGMLDTPYHDQAW